LPKYNNLAPLSRLSKCKELVMGTIHDIDAECYPHTYDTFSQIRYHKEWLPPLLAKAFFFDHCYRLELQKGSSTPDQLRPFIEQELNTIGKFFDTHYQLCLYYDSRSDYRDSYSFTDRNTDPQPIDIAAAGLPTHIKLNPACLLLGCILANRQYLEVLKAELENPETTVPLKANSPKVEYKGTDESLIDIALALHAKGLYLVDGKAATQEYFIQRAREETGRPLKNWKVRASNMRKDRKGERTFLLELHDNLIAYEDKVLEGGRPHKALRRNAK